MTATSGVLLLLLFIAIIVGFFSLNALNEKIRKLTRRSQSLQSQLKQLEQQQHAQAKVIEQLSVRAQHAPLSASSSASVSDVTATTPESSASRSTSDTQESATNQAKTPNLPQSAQTPTTAKPPTTQSVTQLAALSVSDAVPLTVKQSNADSTDTIDTAFDAKADTKVDTTTADAKVNTKANTTADTSNQYTYAVGLQQKNTDNTLARAQAEPTQTEPAQTEQVQTVSTEGNAANDTSATTAIETQAITSTKIKSTTASVAASQDSLPDEPSLFDKGLILAKNWLTTGNIPVKIGMLILIAAVIAFLRYATNQGWLQIPITFKLLGIAGAATAALVFAWLKRDSKRSFSLSVQGGSMGILLLVVFAAVKLYGLLSPITGFAFSLPIVLLAAILAVQQNAKVLAVMAIFAGFLAPIWLSDGTGSHVVLFSYYAILNVGIFIVAWLKPWRELNLMGFVFTYVIGSIWGGLKYQAEHFATTEPFVVLFFAFYLLIPLRYCQRQAQGDSRYAGKVDAALLFGTPMVTLGLQVGMLYQYSTRLALACLLMGVVYAVLALLLYRKVKQGKSVYETLQKAYTGLAAGLMTLSVPIGLSAQATTTIFAVEGAGALWLGLRERRWLTFLAGGGLQLAAAVGFAIVYLNITNFERAFINDYFLNALLIAASAGLSTWFCARYRYREKDSDLYGIAATVFDNSTLTWLLRLGFFWALAWWLGSVLHEVAYFSPEVRRLHDILIVFTLTATMVAIAYRPITDKVLPATTALLLASGLLFALMRLLTVYLNSYGQLPAHAPLGSYVPLSMWELLAWGVFTVLGWVSWRCLRRNDSQLLDFAVATWVLALLVVSSAVIYQCLPFADRNMGSYWAFLSIGWMLVLWLLAYRPQWLAYCCPRPNMAWQNGLGTVVASVLGLVLLRLLTLSGGKGFWLPLLNTLELLQLLITALIVLYTLKSLKPSSSKQRTTQTSNAQASNRQSSASQPLWLHGLCMVFIITVTLRLMHHWGGLAWSPKLLLTAFTHQTTWGDWYWWSIFGLWLVLAGVLSLTRLNAWLHSRYEVWEALRCMVLNSLSVVLSLSALLLLLQSGDIAPLPWIPLLNPLEALILLVAIFVLSRLPHQITTQQSVALIPLSILLSITMVMVVLTVTMRLAVHWGGAHFSLLALFQAPATASDAYWLYLYGLWVILVALLWVRQYRLSLSDADPVSRFALPINLPINLLVRTLLNIITALLAIVWLVCLFKPGHMATWIPLLNPLAILQWVVLGLVYWWLQHSPQWHALSQRIKLVSLLIPVMVLTLISVMTLRFVHHSGDIDWGLSMFSTAMTQMALTVVWSILGVIAWIVGSKRQSRPLWWLGATLMGVVLVKLVLVDRGHLGNLFGILSFFAYGLLCVIVGYFAAVPPAESQSSEFDDEFDDKDDKSVNK